MSDKHAVVFLPSMTRSPLDGRSSPQRSRRRANHSAGSTAQRGTQRAAPVGFSACSQPRVHGDHDAGYSIALPGRRPDARDLGWSIRQIIRVVEFTSASSGRSDSSAPCQPFRLRDPSNAERARTGCLGIDLLAVHGMCPAGGGGIGPRSDGSGIGLSTAAVSGRRPSARV